MLECDLVVGGVFISVCPAHAGTDSKLVTLGSCSFHYRAAEEFFYANFHTLRPSANPLARASDETPVSKKKHIYFYCRIPPERQLYDAKLSYLSYQLTMCSMTDECRDLEPVTVREVLVS